MRFLVFGDSIAQGYFDSSGGWVVRVASHYQQMALDNPDSDWVMGFNLGISGNTAEDVLARLELETKPRLQPNRPLVIILAVGFNDAALRDNISLHDAYTFQESYEKIIKKAQKYTDNILCVGLTAVDEELTHPWRYALNREQWKNNRLNLFEDTIKQSTERKGVGFVPVHDKFLRLLTQDRNILADGLHPNDAGHEFIASLVHGELKKILHPT